MGIRPALALDIHLDQRLEQQDATHKVLDINLQSTHPRNEGQSEPCKLNA